MGGMRYTERMEIRLSPSMYRDLARLRRDNHDESVSSCVRRLIREATKDYRKVRRTTGLKKRFK